MLLSRFNILCHIGELIQILLAVTHDLVGKPDDVYDRLRAPLGNLFFGGEAVCMDDPQGSAHGAYSAGVMAADNCHKYLLEKQGHMINLPLVSVRHEILETTIPLRISRM